MMNLQAAHHMPAEALPNWPLAQSYSELPAHAYSICAPTPVKTPSLVLYNDSLAQALRVPDINWDDATKAQLFSGNLLPSGCTPIAQAYAGHQYAHFTMLGDGRAHLLGEHRAPDGTLYDIQFKGSGQTPFSRSGDGRAALGPMLREYLISEAMAALNIPTTRSLAVTLTGEPVMRETMLQGAILTRVAASHLRVGTFEYFAAQRDVDGLRQLADFAIDRHYPHAKGANTPYLALLESVMQRQATLMCDWLRVGFVHGVMNTDNMAISGETIDYGPCAFMDAYDPQTVFSSIDRHGRYAYANQPPIAQWNLTRFAESILPLLHEEIEQAVSIAEQTLERFGGFFQSQWLNMMRQKLGLTDETPEDEALIKDWVQLMQHHALDYTNSFRALMDGSLDLQPPDLAAWHSRWRERQSEKSNALMQAANPVIIPRNHQVEAVLSAAEEGNMKPFHSLLDALQTPYEDSTGKAPYKAPPTPSERVHQTFCGT